MTTNGKISIKHYLKLANGWPSALGRRGLDGIEHDIMWWAFRHTYGRRVERGPNNWVALKFTPYSWAQIARETGRSKPAVSRKGRGLLRDGLLVDNSKGEIGPNPHIDAWKRSPKGLPWRIDGGCPQATLGVPTGNGGVPTGNPRGAYRQPKRCPQATLGVPTGTLSVRELQSTEGERKTTPPNSGHEDDPDAWLTESLPDPDPEPSEDPAQPVDNPVDNFGPKQNGRYPFRAWRKYLITGMEIAVLPDFQPGWPAGVADNAYTRAEFGFLDKPPTHCSDWRYTDHDKQDDLEYEWRHKCRQRAYATVLHQALLDGLTPESERLAGMAASDLEAWARDHGYKIEPGYQEQDSPPAADALITLNRWANLLRARSMPPAKEAS